MIFCNGVLIARLSCIDTIELKASFSQANYQDVMQIGNRKISKSLAVYENIP